MEDLSLEPVVNLSWLEKEYRARMYFLLTSPASKEQTLQKAVKFIIQADPKHKSILLDICKDILKNKEHVFKELSEMLP